MLQKLLKSLRRKLFQFKLQPIQSLRTDACILFNIFYKILKNDHYDVKKPILLNKDYHPSRSPALLFKQSEQISTQSQISSTDSRSFIRRIKIFYIIINKNKEKKTQQNRTHESMQSKRLTAKGLLIADQSKIEQSEAVSTSLTLHSTYPQCSQRQYRFTQFLPWRLNRRFLLC